MLPINGRIAIVDDSIEQALPLMREFGKRRLSYSYYDGLSENLPPKGEGDDIRLVFLDVNLVDNSVRPIKELYSMVFGIMDRLIGNGNLPYMLVCWSRNEDEYNEIIKKLNVDLSERRPLCSIPLQKSEFFTLDGKPTEGFDSNIEKLFDNISHAISPHTSFLNLLFWENHVHSAVNHALEDALSGIKNVSWDDAADWIFTKWGQAYSGKNFAALEAPDKLRSAFHTLNLFLHETIEEDIDADTTSDLNFHSDDGDKGISVSSFNERLIFSFCQTYSQEPGRIALTPDNYINFDESLNFCFVRNQELIPEKEMDQIREKGNPKKLLKQYYSEVKESVKESWSTFKLVINAPCDYAQKKVVMNKIIPGMFIKSEFRKWFANPSNALFISPNFHCRFTGCDCFFILDFRYLTSEEDDKQKGRIKLKQVVLAEILSKLSRYINRQGLLMLE